jgi:hypothetical protein
MVLSGYDQRTKRIHFTDPNRPQYPFNAALNDFIDPTSSWRSTHRGAKYSWTGRVLIFWVPASDQERKLNAKDRCPACTKSFAGRRNSFCPNCNAFIDKRSNTQVQRGLDLIALSTTEFKQTAVDLKKMRKAFKELSGDMRISDQNWRRALLNYPLAPVDGSEIVTLKQYLFDWDISGDTLSTAQMENIVAAGEQWEERMPR